MHIDIVKRWNETVKPKDIVFILGDFSLNPKWVELYIPQLNGAEKHLIMGNHDSCFPNKRGQKEQRTLNMRDRYFKAGFTSIELTYNILIGNYSVQLSHFPFAPTENDKNENTDLRYMSLRPENQGQILLHGHSHCHYRKLGKMIDVGFDGDLKLWSEDEIIKLIEDPRDYIPSPITEHYKNRKQNEEV